MAVEVNNSVDTNYNDNVSSAPRVSFEASLLDKDYIHAVHCMVWAKWDDHLALKKYPAYAAVLMQLRCDACLGFPGGVVDDDMTGLTVEQAEETCLNALVRELVEEMNLDAERHVIKKEDYLFTYRHPEPSKKLYLHFYTLEVSLESFSDIESRAMKAPEFGHEVFGYMRVPLFTMQGGYKGFPLFLNQDFIRSSKQQLLEGLEAKGIMSKELIKEAIESSRANRGWVY